MPDNFSEHLLLLRADFTVLAALVKELGSTFYDQQKMVLGAVEQTYERLDEVGQQMHSMSQHMQVMSQHIATTSQVARTALTQSHVALAESTEQFNQLSGRMKLTENRMTAMLGAVDSDRTEWRVLYKELEERVTEVEKRLPPTD